jgi:dCMP deaminase
MTTWDEHLINLAFETAKKSKDPNTKVGCVIVGEDKEPLSAGFNGAPIGTSDASWRYERQAIASKGEGAFVVSAVGPRAKDLFVAHAEENAVSLAARSGHRLRGGTAYVTHHPCSRCARSLIQAGVKRVVVADWTKTGMPEIEFAAAATMFTESGVEITKVLA